MRVAPNKYRALLVAGKQSPKGSGLKPANYVPLPTRSPAVGEAQRPRAEAVGGGEEARGRGGPSGGGEAGELRAEAGAGGTSEGEAGPGSPHLLRRALLQHILLHGHGPRGTGGDTGGGVRLLAPPPTLAATLRRAPGSGADGRGGQRPGQPGAKAMAAGVRGHRGLAMRRRLRGPRRRPHNSVRPPQRGCSAAAPAMGGRRTLGRGRARASRTASRARALLRWRSRGTAGKAEGTEGAAGQNGAIRLAPLPQPPSPPPLGGSSPAESRPPAALTLHCDPRGGGAGRSWAGRAAAGSRPPAPPPPRLARARRSRVERGRARQAGPWSRPCGRLRGVRTWLR